MTKTSGDPHSKHVGPNGGDYRRPGSRRARMARRGIAVLPTLFTLGNLLCGFAAIFLATRPTTPPIPLPFDWSPLTFATLCVFAGMLFDGVDGRVARITRSMSDLGEQLDSMADMVTFGVAPAIMAVQLVDVGLPFVAEVVEKDSYFGRIALIVAFIYVSCAALRLARFNIERGDATPDHTRFKGLPTPGAGGTVVSLVLVHQHFLRQNPAEHWTIAVAAGVMVIVMLLVAVSMVSNYRYVHVMNRYVSGRVPFKTMVLVVIVGPLMVIHPQLTLAAGFVLYALSAPVIAASHWFKLRRRASPAPPPA